MQLWFGGKFAGNSCRKLTNHSSRHHLKYKLYIVGTISDCEIELTKALINSFAWQVQDNRYQLSLLDNLLTLNPQLMMLEMSLMKNGCLI